MARIKQHQQQVNAVQLAYDTLLDAYNRTLSEDVRAKLMAALNALAVSFPNDEVKPTEEN
jgi:hypothetical protein